MTALATNLSAAALQILAKEAATAKGATRDALTIGDTDVDEIVTLHLTGTVRAGADYTQEIVAKADPWTLLAAALSHLNGVTIESLTAEALAADPKLIASIKKQAKAAIATVKGPTATECKGKVTLPAKSVAVIDTMAAEAAATLDAAASEVA
tara:strand:+ start:49 stop:507 length:459 start_codon:yes stop_codon:yes gene_type:complete